MGKYQCPLKPLVIVDLLLETLYALLNGRLDLLTDVIFHFQPNVCTLTYIISWLY